MPRARRGALGALAAAGLALAGCATGAGGIAPTLDRIRAEEAAELVRRWEADRDAFSGLRAAVDLTLRVRGRTDRTAALLLLAPRELRLEVSTPLGLPGLVATANPERLVIFRPLERRAAVAPSTPETVARWLGTPVTVEVLIGFLVGHVPLPESAPIRIETGGGAHLAYSRDGVAHRVWVTPQGQPARALIEPADGGNRLAVTFEWGINGRVQSVRVEAPRRGAELTLRYVSAEPGAPPPGAFELILPPDVSLEPLN